MWYHNGFKLKSFYKTLRHRFLSKFKFIVVQSKNYCWKNVWTLFICISSWTVNSFAFNQLAHNNLLIKLTAYSNEFKNLKLWLFLQEFGEIPERCKHNTRIMLHTVIETCQYNFLYTFPTSLLLKSSVLCFSSELIRK